MVSCTAIIQAREENNRKDVAIVRMEQLYPLPEKQINAIIDKYNPEQLIWAQEEPENMGMESYLKLAYLPFEVVARSECSNC